MAETREEQKPAVTEAKAKPGSFQEVSRKIIEQGVVLPLQRPGDSPDRPIARRFPCTSCPVSGPILFHMQK